MALINYSFSAKIKWSLCKSKRVNVKVFYQTGISSRAPSQSEFSCCACFLEQSLREIDLEEIKPSRNWSSWEAVVVRCFIRDRLYPVSPLEKEALFHSGLLRRLLRIGTVFPVKFKSRSAPFSFVTVSCVDAVFLKGG